MSIFYYRLFDLLNRRGLKKGDLMRMADFSNATMAKLSSNKIVQTDIIDRICAALECQPGDIMEYGKDSTGSSATAYMEEKGETQPSKKTSIADGFGE